MAMKKPAKPAKKMDKPMPGDKPMKPGDKFAMMMKMKKAKSAKKK